MQLSALQVAMPVQLGRLLAGAGLRSQLGRPGKTLVPQVEESGGLGEQARLERDPDHPVHHVVFGQRLRVEQLGATAQAAWPGGAGRTSQDRSG